MLLLSIQPFSPRKLLVFGAVILGFSMVSCFASSTFFTVDSTPYDRQMSRIRPVLSSGESDERGERVSLALVNHWMGDLRDIPYGYQMEWKTPAEVQSRRPADCKGKAVALYQRMQRNGARNVRLVIGKRAPTNGGSFVLDPTFNWMAFRSEHVRERSYVPLYAYAGTKKYRAASSDLYAKN